MRKRDDARRSRAATRSAAAAAPHDGSLKRHIQDFIEYLQFNRNASEHTVRAYESDLDQFLTASAQGRPRPTMTAADFSPDNVRLYLGILFHDGVSRASAARKLAAVRSFARWLRREGLIEDDPSAMEIGRAHV